MSGSYLLLAFQINIYGGIIVPLKRVLKLDSQTMYSGMRKKKILIMTREFLSYHNTKIN